MITYRKRGDTWEYRIRYTDPVSGRQREKSKKGFRTKQEAKTAAMNVDLERLPSGEDPGNPMMLHQWLSYYMRTYRTDKVSDHTQSSNESSTKRVLQFYPQMQLAKVTPEGYQEFLNHLEQQGYSQATIHTTHTFMHGAMEQARKNRRISHNPCTGASLPKKPKDAKLRYLPPEHISSFLEQVKQRSLEHYFFFLTLLDTGMRKGEALALTWEDIDLPRQTIYVNKTYVARTRSIGPTKNKKSRRIRISEHLKKELLTLVNLQNQHKQAYGELYQQPELVFTTKDGRYLSNTSLFRTMRHACEAIGVDDLPIHSLRHTHAVLHLEAGTSMKVLQERLGHSSLKVTADVYTHVSESFEKDSMKKYEATTKRHFS